MRLADIERQEAETAAALAAQVPAARERIAKYPPQKLQERLPQIQEREADARSALIAAETAAREAATANVLDDADGAHDEAYDVLVAARHAHEKASQALAALHEEIRKSWEAHQIVSREDARIKADEECEADKAEARKLLAKFEKHLAIVRETSAQLRVAVSKVSSHLNRGRESWQGIVLEVPYLWDLCWINAVPHVWAPGKYDFFRSGFTTDPNAITERPAIPTFSEALTPFIGKGA